MHYNDCAHCDAATTLAAHPTALFELHPARRLPASDVAQALQELHQNLGITLAVPLALPMFTASTELEALTHFFPIIRSLATADRRAWMGLFRSLMHDARITVQWTARGSTRPAPFALRALVIGQIVSCFVSRPALAEHIAASLPTFGLCSDQRTYEAAGGISGGCYDPTQHRLLLVADRLFEGHTTPNPGVSPLLHEFGHMLDGVQRFILRLPHCVGLLPGMDAALTADWHAAKADEVTRYRRYAADPQAASTYPLGHPYVFQTDGEFVAGYWELFWRNPHAFAAHTPLLYGVLVQYVGHDPRTYTTDFVGYVTGNRAFYTQKKPAWHSAIRLVNER